MEIWILDMEEDITGKELIEHQFWWQTKIGNAKFKSELITGQVWVDYTMLHLMTTLMRVEVYEVMNSGRWNTDKLAELLPEDIVQHIINTVQPPCLEKDMDKPWWLQDTKGGSSVKSDCKNLRLRGQTMEIYKYMWIKGLPFKIFLRRKKKMGPMGISMEISTKKPREREEKKEIMVAEQPEGHQSLIPEEATPRQIQFPKEEKSGLKISDWIQQNLIRQFGIGSRF